MHLISIFTFFTLISHSKNRAVQFTSGNLPHKVNLNGQNESPIKFEWKFYSNLIFLNETLLWIPLELTSFFNSICTWIVKPIENSLCGFKRTVKRSIISTIPVNKFWNMLNLFYFNFKNKRKSFKKLSSYGKDEF